MLRSKGTVPDKTGSGSYLLSMICGASAQHPGSTLSLLQGLSGRRPHASGDFATCVNSSPPHIYVHQDSEEAPSPQAFLRCCVVE